jgi:hypothetical protein
MRGPAHPDQLRSAFDTGDHFHPNDAGDKAKAAAIDRRFFDISMLSMKLRDC